MDKILEALKNLLPEEDVKTVSEAVAQLLEDARKELDAEYSDKLEEAYADFTEQQKNAEAIAEQGYTEAWGFITDLRNRLDVQKNEFEETMQHEYEEAYKMLQEEKAKNDNIAAELYEEYDKRLSEMKEYIVEKVDEFLKYQGNTIYEQARRDVMNDPRMAEHKVAYDKIVDIVACDIDNADVNFATSSKLEEATKAVEQLRSQVRLLEGRNVKLSTENTRLQESVREAAVMLNESTKQQTKVERKERLKRADNASGRGRLVMEGIIPEHVDTPTKASADDETAINENSLQYQYQVLAGIKKA